MSIKKLCLLIFKGTELGIGEGAAIKLVAEVTGRSAAKIKQAMAEIGDLGQIAETSKGSQKLMFQPARLTVRGVYESFLKVAKVKGKDVSNSFILLCSHVYCSLVDGR